MVFSSSFLAFASTEDPDLIGLNSIGVSPYFVGVLQINYDFYNQGNDANVDILVIPYPNKLTKATFSVDVKKDDGTLIKNWTSTGYINGDGDITFSNGCTLPGRGTYQMNASIKCYNGSTLIETINSGAKYLTY